MDGGAPLGRELRSIPFWGISGGSGFYGTLDMPEKASDTLAAFALPDDSL